MHKRQSKSDGLADVTNAIDYQDHFSALTEWDFTDLFSETKTGRSRKRLLEHDIYGDIPAGGLWAGPVESPVAEKITRRPRTAQPAGPVAPRVSIGSPEYFATLRRRHVNALLPLVTDLQAWAESDLFVVKT